MKVKMYSIGTTNGRRFGLITEDGQVLKNATARWKTKRGALNFCKKMGYELVGEWLFKL